VGPLHDFENLLDPLSHLRTPAVDLSESRKLGVLLPHDIGAEESDEGIDVTPVPRVKDAQSQLDVLPRNRLLPQPGGVQGLPAGSEPLSVCDREQESLRPIDGDATLTANRVESAQSEDLLLTEIAKLVDFER
jgi:hypothetical protein